MTWNLKLYFCHFCIFLNLTWVNNIKNTSYLFDVRGDSLKNSLTSSIHEMCRAGFKKSGKIPEVFNKWENKN